jgi:SAM-dependent methyltransferase
MSDDAGAQPVRRSFRDPAGHLVAAGGRIFRIVNEAGVASVDAVLNSPALQPFVQDGRIIGTRRVPPSTLESLPHIAGTGAALILEHDRVAFPSYPYEWSPDMLHAAAGLTLDLAEAALAADLILKDATPYNVLFVHTAPVFVDVLSFEPREILNRAWPAYAQFVRCFLLPLMVQRHFGLPLDMLLTTRRDGLEPGEVYRMYGPLRRLQPAVLELVTLPAWLERFQGGRRSGGQPSRARSRDESAWVLGRMFRHLRRLLAACAPRPGESVWSAYAGEGEEAPGAEYAAAKLDFVSRALDELEPSRVLDVGCNVGDYSLCAADRGASVVAIDRDPAVIGRLWRTARTRKATVLPLAVDIARPSARLGWNNGECAAFTDRAKSGFDAVLMLALVHHLLVSDRVPLDEVIDLASELTTDALIVEYVEPADLRFREIARGRDELHRHLTSDVFEDACRRRFDIARSQTMPGGTRTVYLLRKRMAC